MGSLWVANASPLILLGRIGQIDLITQLVQRIAIPTGVVQEIQVGPLSDPARMWIEGRGAKWVAPVNRIDPLVAGWDLGLGESHVLTLCREKENAEALLDDRAARKCAAVLQIPVRGTVALIVLAKRKGIIANAKPLLDGLVDQGIRVDAALMETALRLAGEKRTEDLRMDP